MITDTSRYYGCVFHQIIEYRNTISIRSLYEDTSGFYLLDNLIPLYIKYSTARAGSWTFNFQFLYQEKQRELFETYGECLTILVCGKDGIAALEYEEFRKILDENFEAQEAVSIRRRHNEMYKIRGRDGVLDRKISKNSLCELLSKYFKP